MTRSRPASGPVRKVAMIALLAITHLALVVLTGIVAHGPDLDRLRSRSRFSEVAGALHDLLMLPHDAAFRAIPSPWLIHNPGAIPLLLLANSLLWAIVLTGAARVIARSRASGAPARRSR